MKAGPAHAGWLAALALLVAPGCPGRESNLGRESSPDREPPNVLLVVVDSLRADRLGCYGHDGALSPAIDALAERSVLFESAYSAAPWTMPSVATMLTGLYPSRHGVTELFRLLADEIDTLPEIAGARGYATGAVISHLLIGTHFQFDQGFEAFSQEEALGHFHFSTPGVTDRARALMEELAAGPEPFFLLVHYFDPHFQYLEHPGRDYPSKAASKLTARDPFNQLQRRIDELEEPDLAFLNELYDEEIRLTDEGIGRLLEAVRELGLEERTVVVLTADHGEEFMSHGGLGHGHTLYEELVEVPLLMSGPGMTAGIRVGRPVSLVSLTPTLLELMGIEHSRAPFQAASFAGLLRGDGAPDEPVFAEVDFVDMEGEGRRDAHKRTIIEERYKLIRDERTGRVELYDLTEDPDETGDLSERQPDRVARMLAALDRHFASLDEALAPVLEREPTMDELLELEKLGYVDLGNDEDPDD